MPSNTHSLLLSGWKNSIPLQGYQENQGLITAPNEYFTLHLTLVLMVYAAAIHLE